MVLRPNGTLAQSTAQASRHIRMRAVPASRKTRKKGDVPPAEQVIIETQTIEPSDHALGRSHGGLTTKIHLISDAKARPVSAVLSAGQTHDSKCLQALL